MIMHVHALGTRPKGRRTMEITLRVVAGKLMKARETETEGWKKVDVETEEVNADGINRGKVESKCNNSRV